MLYLRVLVQDQSESSSVSLKKLSAVCSHSRYVLHFKQPVRHGKGGFVVELNLTDIEAFLDSLRHHGFEPCL